MKKCSACNLRTYCKQKCQKGGWKAQKQCKKLQNVFTPPSEGKAAAGRDDGGGGGGAAAAGGYGSGRLRQRQRVVGARVLQDESLSTCTQPAWTTRMMRAWMAKRL